MSVARVTEIIASSDVSFDDAVQQGVARAVKTLKNVRSAWVQDQKVHVENMGAAGSSSPFGPASGDEEQDRRTSRR